MLLARGSVMFRQFEIVMHDSQLLRTRLWPPGINSVAVQAPRLLLALVRTWLKRHQSRQELLNYIAQDHRAAADMGTTRAEAEDWARRPFWRP